MSWFRNVVAYSALSWFLSEAGGASSRANEPVEGPADDATLTVRVRRELLGDTTLKTSSNGKAAAIEIETHEGVVLLRGPVASRAAIERALWLAAGVNGVVSVTNGMFLDGAT